MWWIILAAFVFAIGIRIIKWKIKCAMMAKEFEHREKRREAIERKREFEAWREQRNSLEE